MTNRAAFVNEKGTTNHAGFVNGKKAAFVNGKGRGNDKPGCICK
jgi:hypothetical protein